MKNVTFKEITNAANYTMSVERKETRTGRVSFVHTVFFKGEVFETRTSKREYGAYWMNIEAGRVSRVSRENAKYSEKMAAEYRAGAAKGGEYYHGGRGFHTPEQFTKWAENAEADVQRQLAALAEAEANGPDYDYATVDGGFCGRPDLAKGNVVVVAA